MKDWQQLREQLKFNFITNTFADRMYKQYKKDYRIFLEQCEEFPYHADAIFHELQKKLILEQLEQFEDFPYHANVIFHELQKKLIK